MRETEAVADTAAGPRSRRAQHCATISRLGATGRRGRPRRGRERAGARLSLFRSRAASARRSGARPDRDRSTTPPPWCAARSPRRWRAPPTRRAISCWRSPAISRKWRASFSRARRRSPTPSSSIAPRSATSRRRPPWRAVRAWPPASPRRSPKSASAKRFWRSPAISRPICPRARCGASSSGSATTPRSREALLARPGCPPALRNELAAATARALADFAARRDWLAPERAAAHRPRGARTGDRHDLRLVRSASELADLVAPHARRGNADRRRADARPAQRRSRLLRSGAGRDFRPRRAARVRRSRATPRARASPRSIARRGLPSAFLPAFRAALAGIEALRPPRGDRISRALAERVIEACERRAEPGLAPIQSLRLAPGRRSRARGRARIRSTTRPATSRRD